MAYCMNPEVHFFLKELPSHFPRTGISPPFFGLYISWGYSGDAGSGYFFHMVQDDQAGRNQLGLDTRNFPYP